MTILQVVLVWLAITSVIAFLNYGWDKGRAQKDKRRVPERILLAWSMVEDSLGDRGLTGIDVGHDADVAEVTEALLLRLGEVGGGKGLGSHVLEGCTGSPRYSGRSPCPCLIPTILGSQGAREAANFSGKSRND